MEGYNEYKEGSYQKWTQRSRWFSKGFKSNQNNILKPLFYKNSKEEAISLAAAQENFPIIFRENLALQLEATYRKNGGYAWNELKRRLDYLQEVQETKERFAKEILLKSITGGVSY